MKTAVILTSLGLYYLAFIGIAVLVAESGVANDFACVNPCDREMAWAEMTTSREYQVLVVANLLAAGLLFMSAVVKPQNRSSKIGYGFLCFVAGAGLYAFGSWLLLFSGCSGCRIDGWAVKLFFGAA